MEEEVNILRRYKAKHLGRSTVGLQLDAWDRLFYMRVAQVGALTYTEGRLIILRSTTLVSKACLVPLPGPYIRTP